MVTMAKIQRLTNIAKLCETAGQSASEDPLDGLAALPLIRWHLDTAERELVAAARRAGASWAGIGTALEMNRQSAWEKFSKPRAVSPEIALDPEWHTPL
jgi:hypothetical protein